MHTPAAGEPAQMLRPGRVQVTAQSISASFSARSQPGEVQISLAWAEQLQARPVSRDT